MAPNSLFTAYYANEDLQIRSRAMPRRGIKRAFLLLIKAGVPVRRAKFKDTVEKLLLVAQPPKSALDFKIPIQAITELRLGTVPIYMGYI